MARVSLTCERTLDGYRLNGKSLCQTVLVRSDFKRLSNARTQCPLTEAEDRPRTRLTLNPSSVENISIPVGSEDGFCECNLSGDAGVPSTLPVVPWELTPKRCRTGCTCQKYFANMVPGVCQQRRLVFEDEEEPTEMCLCVRRKTIIDLCFLMGPVLGFVALFLFLSHNQ